MWSTARIEVDSKFIKEFGLKNEKELWKIQTELSKLRGNVRLLLSAPESENINKISDSILSKLVKYGIAAPGVSLEKALDLDETAFLERRLQSLVFRKGLAKSMAQSRQLITHGFIAISGRKIDKPGYRVSVSEEDKLGYYRPINLEAAPKHEESRSDLNNEAKEAVASEESPAVVSE